MPGSRSPLGGGVIALIVLDVVLIAVLGFLLVRGTGSAGSLDASASGVGASSTAGADVAPDVVFTMPSRNITCTIGADAATCIIATFSYAAPTVPDCAGTLGHELTLTADGASWVCSDGASPAKAGSDVAVLAYGESASANGFTCTSSREGVTCTHDDSGHMFTLARGGATLD